MQPFFECGEHLVKNVHLRCLSTLIEEFQVHLVRVFEGFAQRLPQFRAYTWLQADSLEFTIELKLVALQHSFALSLFLATRRVLSRAQAYDELGQVLGDLNKIDGAILKAQSLTQLI